MNHPGGDWWALGGAVTVQVFPLQVTAGKIVRWPMAFPWVLTTEPKRETLRFAVLPEVTVNVTTWLYDQSLLAIVNAGRARPERR